MPQIGPLEIVIVLLIVVLLFGVGRIGKIGGELGKGIREFRKAVQDDGPKKEDVVQDPAATTTSPAATTNETKTGA